MSLPTLAFKSDEIKQSCFVDKIVGLCEMEILLLHLTSQISSLVPSTHPVQGELNDPTFISGHGAYNNNRFFLCMEATP